ncbi:hydantoinase B/oxoprolinase family protein [Bacillus sp. REN16]|uniref:hydantoinase B/oxoprolinase family protein n=1 Tax=Bacillus sp. REN16 TaxID=2887296 RepID=UPI001E39E367|nr:hydantoinase B/oxoprolinase family protein [Bacillus sp. REN16]MCC3358938.1 hydantoinase B/oxoprolinase family protein [Bacillus sp. REN16]
MSRNVDAVTLEIVGNLLLSIAEEMGVALIRSAYSTNIKERRDISTAVFDPDGNMVAQAEHVPMHLGSLLSIIKEVYRKYPVDTIKQGDMFIGNDPYNGGGTHLPDITIVAPVFSHGKLIGWVANLAHHSDVGGKVPGSTSGDAVSIFQEGLKIPLTRLCQGGKVNEEIIDFVLANSRLPGERYGDLNAQIASNRVGMKRLLEAYAIYGDLLVDSMYELQDYAERRLRAGIAKLPDGDYEFTDYMDDAGVASPNPIQISVKISIRGKKMDLDFTGTHQQVEGPINVTYNGLLATVFYAIKALVDPEIPSNAGIYRVFNIIAEPGLIVNSQNPAPVGARIDTCMRVADVIFGAMAPVVPERAIAGCNSSCTTAVFSGNSPTDKEDFYVYLETIAGGSGASMHGDGLNGVQVHLTNTSNLPIEALEMEFPLVLVREYSLITDSGGAGEHRGGQGICRTFEARFDNVSFTGLGDRQKFQPWGLNEGKEGAGGQYYLYRKDGSTQTLSSKCTEVNLRAGDIIEIHTPGAGGYGDPRKRNPNQVLVDVIENKVSEGKALELYGVNVKRVKENYQIVK